jgi:RNA polymerase sigma-70 factor, ECF subfamily
MGEHHDLNKNYESKHHIEEIMESLITNHGDSLRIFAYRFVRDWLIVDDIMQEVYIKVFLKLNTLMDNSSIKSWIFSITANQCRDYLRLKYVRTTILTDTDTFERLPIQNFEVVENEIIDKEDNLLLQRAIESLPTHYREPLVLRYFYHFSYKQISMLLKISIQNIKTRIHRAKK